MNRCFLTTKTFCALAAILVAISVGNVNTTVRAQSDDTIVAKVNDTSITLKEVDHSIFSKLLTLTTADAQFAPSRSRKPYRPHNSRRRSEEERYLC